MRQASTCVVAFGFSSCETALKQYEYVRPASISVRLVSEGVRLASTCLRLISIVMASTDVSGSQNTPLLSQKNSYNRAFLSQKISTYVRLKFLNLRPTCDTLTVTNIVDNLLVDVDYTTYQTALL